MSLKVVKIGGSLGASALLAPLVRGLGRRGPLVIVPGGGAFADAVRAAQGPMGLSDAACHAMAILAMEQTALALCDLAPALVPCRTLPEMAALSAGGRAGVWFPSHLLSAAPDVPQDWSVTSDSLAAWLAWRLDAAGLVLVKSPGAPAPPASARPEGDAAAWAAAGLVDPAFPAFAAAFAGPVACLAADDAAGLAFALTAPRSRSAA